MREFLAEGIEGHRTRDLMDACLAAEASISVKVGGESIGYRRLPVLIRQEGDRDRRAALEAGRLSVIAETLNPLLLDTIEKCHGVAGELLGTTYDAYCEQLAGVDFDTLEEEVSAFLAGSRDMLSDLLAYYVRRGLPGVRPDDLRTHDLVHLLYGPDFHALFPTERMIERVAGCVASMGLDLTAGGRIKLDLEDRPTKAPRAFCAPIRVPEEVMLVLQPHGGHDDYATFLHELGHALHFANVDANQPVEFRHLGDYGVTEGYAMTLDHLMQVPEFLRGVVGIDSPDDFLRFSAFRELVMLRRYAAKFLYERSLHSLGPSEGRAAEYAERLTEATGARTPPVLYLDDVDPHFYCIRYVRAWMLAGTLHAALRERFDVDWFVNPRTGAFLADLWSLGQALPAERLAQERLGVERLSFEPLLEMVHERF
ncbi:hypothetical protein BH18GEM1_BH18GEM1_16490 [soil metagenome]